MARQMSRGSQVAFAKSMLERKNIESQTVDVHSHIDSSLSYEENIKNINKLLGLGGRSKQKAARGLSAAECDVAIGNCEAGFLEDCKDACKCGDPDACEVKVPRKKAAPKAKPHDSGIKKITNNMPAGYEIRKWSYGSDYGKVTEHAVYLKGKPVFNQNKTFKSLTDARKAVKEHASNERSRERNRKDREQFEKHGHIGERKTAKAKTTKKKVTNTVKAQATKRKKRSAQTTMSGRKKPQKKPAKVKKCVRVKVRTHTRKCPTRKR